MRPAPSAPEASGSAIGCRGAPRHAPRERRGLLSGCSGRSNLSVVETCRARHMLVIKLIEICVLKLSVLCFRSDSGLFWRRLRAAARARPLSRRRTPSGARPRPTSISRRLARRVRLSGWRLPVRCGAEAEPGRPRSPRTRERVPSGRAGCACSVPLRGVEERVVQSDLRCLV